MVCGISGPPGPPVPSVVGKERDQEPGSVMILNHSMEENLVTARVRTVEHVIKDVALKVKILDSCIYSFMFTLFYVFEKTRPTLS